MRTNKGIWLWIVRTSNAASSSCTPTQMFVCGGLCARVLSLQCRISFDQFRDLSLGDNDWDQMVFVTFTLAIVGLYVCMRPPALSLTHKSMNLTPGTHGSTCLSVALT
jgi:hypothetical protein